ncbi:MAG TPA: YncE family protein, partial [Nitrospiraceae bacterium]|nr:YncE family protein [Nitrospiraceae bacterium]
NFMIASGFNKLLFINMTDGSTAKSVGSGSVDDFALSYDKKYVLTRWVVDIPTKTIVASLPTLPGFLDLIATSPANYRGIQAQRLATQRFSVVNINGASAAVELNLPGGAAPEGDAPTDVAIAPNGLTAVTVNWESHNASIVDLVTGTTVAWISVGKNPDDVAITPDGKYALVTNALDDSVSIIDLATRTVVKTLTGILGNPRHVVVSHDGQQAFVNTTGANDSTDKVYFLNVQGASSSILGSLTVGNLANEISQYTEMTLSSDGTLLAVPVTRDNEVVLINTATRTEVARLATGTSPTEAAFSPDGSRLYTLNEASRSVTVVDVNGANSSLRANVGTLGDPVSMAVDDSGQYLYVVSNSVTNSINVVEVLDTAALNMVQTVNLATSASPSKAHLNGRLLYITASDGIPVGAPLRNKGGHLLRIAADGPASRFVDDTLLHGLVRRVTSSDALNSAIAVAFNTDGLNIVQYDGDGVGDEDYFRFNPSVGDQLLITASVPDDDPGDVQNKLDVAIELYSP